MKMIMNDKFKKLINKTVSKHRLFKQAKKEVLNSLKQQLDELSKKKFAIEK